MRPKGKNSIIFLVILFVLIGAATFGHLQRTGRLGEYQEVDVDINGAVPEEEVDIQEEKKDLHIGVVEEDVVQEEEEVAAVTEEEAVIDKEIIAAPEREVVDIVSEGRIFEEIAAAGEGITHLARRVAKRYLEENPVNPALTPEHRIFVEDHIQNRVGYRGLKIGETINISEDLIVEAINKAQGLTNYQLEHLENFSELVWASGF